MANAQRLAELIRECLIEEFNEKHLTGNLAASIKIIESEDGKISVVIPADKYEVALYIYRKILVYKGQGSYASHLDKHGSPWGNHQGFVGRAVQKAIELWMKEEQITGKVG